MRTLLAVVCALALVGTASAAPEFPPDKKVPMALDAEGNPVNLPAGTWFQVDAFQHGLCGGIVLTDSARTAVVLYRMPVQKDTPAVFYVIYADEAVTEWAGNIKLCEDGTDA